MQQTQPAPGGAGPQPTPMPGAKSGPTFIDKPPSRSAFCPSKPRLSRSTCSCNSPASFLYSSRSCSTVRPLRGVLRSERSKHLRTRHFARRRRSQLVRAHAIAIALDPSVQARGLEVRKGEQQVRQVALHVTTTAERTGAKIVTDAPKIS